MAKKKTEKEILEEAAKAGIQVCTWSDFDRMLRIGYARYRDGIKEYFRPNRSLSSGGEWKQIIVTR
jgi:hypothetical protein